MAQTDHVVQATGVVYTDRAVQGQNLGANTVGTYTERTLPTKSMTVATGNWDYETYGNDMSSLQATENMTWRY